MGIVSTIPEKCRRCYACVRECPVKAIKVIAGQATVIAEQCIACGNCVKVCTQKAKRIEDATMLVTRMLEGGERVIACVAPSYPVAFPQIAHGKIVGALRRLGFAEVWEVALGAELISAEYARRARQAIRSGQAVVSTPCPAIVSYVQKYMPGAARCPCAGCLPDDRHCPGHQAQARRRCPRRLHRSVHREEGGDHGTRSCRASSMPCSPSRSSWRCSPRRGSTPTRRSPGRFDGPPAGLGRSLPISGGLLRAAGIDADILQNSVLVTEGKDRVLPALKELAEGKSKARVLDVLFCEGCINGPKMTNTMSVFARKEMLTDHINEQNPSIARTDMGSPSPSSPGWTWGAIFPSRPWSFRSPRRNRSPRPCVRCGSSHRKTS